MTLNIKAGDWAVLRNGSIVGPLEIDRPRLFPVRLQLNKTTFFAWTTKGEEYLAESTDGDIIATLPCPPLERIRQLEEALRDLVEDLEYRSIAGVVNCNNGVFVAARRALGENK